MIPGQGKKTKLGAADFDCELDGQESPNLFSLGGGIPLLRQDRYTSHHNDLNKKHVQIKQKIEKKKTVVNRKPFYIKVSTLLSMKLPLCRKRQNKKRSDA